MADSKITALTALTAADPVNDMFPVVDVSDTSMAASGTTKKISVNNILGASGTATLASATITGAATVGTTLGVTGVSTLTGAVGVGATPIGKFDVYAVASDTNIFIRSDTDKSGQIVFRDNLNAGNSGKVRYDHLNERLSFAADGAENLYLLSTGDLSLIAGNVVVSNGKGIDFSATASGSGTMTSELLNDYEEGTWTPVIADATTGGNVGTVTINSATYTKIGRQVSIQCDLRSITTTGMTGGNNLFIRGLPFTSVKGGNGSFYTYRVGRNASTVSSAVTVEHNVSLLYLSLFTASSANTNLSILVSDITSGTSELALSVTYTV